MSLNIEYRSRSLAHFDYSYLLCTIDLAVELNKLVVVQCPHPTTHHIYIAGTISNQQHFTVNSSIVHLYWRQLTSSGFVHCSLGSCECLRERSRARFNLKIRRFCSFSGSRRIASATSGFSSRYRSSRRRPGKGIGGDGGGTVTADTDTFELL